ncbi:MAG: hypothetical protein WDN44_06530 [Sphingomonas sp.]
MPDLKHERRHARLHKGPVAGVDEAGRGPLAGPVVAAAVVLDPKCIPEGIDDSKVLTAAKRGRSLREAGRMRADRGWGWRASRRSTGSTSSGRRCWR